MTPESLLIGGLLMMVGHMLLMLRDLMQPSVPLLDLNDEATVQRLVAEGRLVDPRRPGGWDGLIVTSDVRYRVVTQPTGPRIKPPPPPSPAGSAVSTRRPSTPQPTHPPPPMPRPREPTSVKG